jgi:hypothetical protein
MFEQRLKEGEGKHHKAILEKRISRRRNSKFKGLEAESRASRLI